MFNYRGRIRPKIINLSFFKRLIIMSRVTVSSKTMPDGSKAKVITETYGDYDIIYQTIKRIFNTSVTVISGTGKLYNVRLSDRVIYENNIEIGDTAEIKTFDNGWLVTNIIKQEKEPEQTPEEEQKEIEKQLKELKDLQYGEY